jgi:hypothetical protein
VDEAGRGAREAWAAVERVYTLALPVPRYLGGIMSADNWAVCPRCMNRAQKALAEATAKVVALYGKIPVEEFDAARAALDEPVEQDYRTFREDYEITGAAEGTVEVLYKGSCRTCGLNLTFTTAREIPGAGD